MINECVRFLKSAGNLLTPALINNSLALQHTGTHAITAVPGWTCLCPQNCSNSSRQKHYSATLLLGMWSHHAVACRTLNRSPMMPIFLLHHRPMVVRWIDIRRLWPGRTHHVPETNLWRFRFCFLTLPPGFNAKTSASGSERIHRTGN